MPVKINAESTVNVLKSSELEVTTASFTSKRYINEKIPQNIVVKLIYDWASQDSFTVIQLYLIGVKPFSLNHYL